MMLQPDFKAFIAVNRNTQTQIFTRFGINMMTPLYGLKLPAVFCQQFAHFLAGESFHTATSNTVSEGLIFIFFTSTLKQPSTAS